MMLHSFKLSFPSAVNLFFIKTSRDVTVGEGIFIILQIFHEFQAETTGSTALENR
jgi:Tfp pilus assembly protein PilZ